MTRFFQVRYIVTLLTLAASLTALGDIRHTVTFSPDAFTVGERAMGDSLYSTLTWQDAMHGHAGEGAPDIPASYYRFIVPKYATDIKVEITGQGGATHLTLPHTLFPVQRPMTTNTDPEEIVPTLPDFVQYADNGIRAWVNDDGYADGDNHIVTIGLIPVEYSHADSEVVCYSDISLKITYTIGNAATSGLHPITPACRREASDLWKEDVINTSDIAQFGGLRTSIAPETTPVYLIVTSEYLKDSFTPLANWKRQKGCDVYVRTIEEIKADPAYALGDTITGVNDDAGKLRAFLTRFYIDHGQSYVLLGGDYTQVPIRYANYVPYVGPFPTDWYFAELNADWDPDKNDILCEFDRNHINEASSVLPGAELNVGRLICFKPEHVANYINKLITYEVNPGHGDTEYLTKALHFIHNHFFDLSPKFKDLLPFDLEVIKGVNGYDTIQACPTGTQLMDKIVSTNPGYMILNGHGDPSGISTSSLYNSNGHQAFGIVTNQSYTWGWIHDEETSTPANGLDRMENYSSPSIINSMACDVAPFDRMDTVGMNYTQKKPYYPYPCEFNFASSFTCGGAWGGVAFLGNTRSGYNGQSDSVQLYLNRQLTNNACIGDAMTQARQHTTGSPYDVYAALTYHLVGDPKFRMWMAKPKTFKPTISKEKDEISLNTADFQSGNIAVWDGLTNVNNYSIGQLSQISTKGHENKSILISKERYLPYRLYNGTNFNLNYAFPKFSVNRAYLGLAKDKPFRVGDGGSLNLNVAEVVQIGEGLIVGNNGEVTITCESNVTVDGGTILRGGKLTIKAKNVTINKSFTVSEGASATIINP